MAQKYSRDQYRSGQHALTKEELERVLRACDDLVTYCAIKVAALCGLRREDLAGLKWKDVDLDQRRISFYESKKRRVKTVPINQELAGDLRRLRNLHPKEHYVLPGHSEKVYGKGHLTGRTLYNYFQDALERAGLSKRPFHSLRATCIKLCQAAGWSEAQTADLVGDTVAVIQEHYMAPSEGEMSRVVEDKPIL